MPKLENPKHEHFCQRYVKTGNQTESYRTVYGDKKGIEANASKLIRNTKVAERIKELQLKLQERNAIDLDNVLNFAIDIRERAVNMEKPDLNVALKANDQACRIIGAYNDKLNIKADIKSLEQIIKEGEENERRKIQ